MTPLGQAALDYAVRGIPVFPLLPGDKRPLPGSRGFLDATTDPAQIAAWWTQRPEANIGTCPGDTGHVVVDVDDKNGHTGSATWAALCAEHGVTDPGTLAVRTPSGGVHLWYLGRMRPSASKLGDGLDIRSEGSYVLLPPSRIGEAEYQWIAQRQEQSAPAFIAARIAARERERQASIIQPDDLDSEINIGRAREKLRQRVAAGDVAVEGSGGNDRTYRLACEVLSIGLSVETATDLIAEEWNPFCDPPWSESELVGIVAHASRYMQNEQGAVGAVPGSELFEAAPAVAKALAESAGRFRIRRPSELVNLKPITFWDVEHKFPRVPEGAVIMLYGPSGEHKTNVLLSKLWDIQLREKANVIYAAGEGRYGLGVRINAQSLARGKMPAEFDETFGEIAIPSIGDTGDVGAFRESLGGPGERPPDILVLDTFATALAGMDEDERAAGLLTANGTIGKLARHFGCLVIVVAHTGKNRQGGIRGASGFYGNVDGVLFVEANKPAGVVRLHCEKMKDAPDDIPDDHYEIALVGGVPVPLPISARAYEWLTGDLDFGRIGGTLAALGAFDRNRGVSAGHIIRSMYPLDRGMEPEDWDRACTRLARKLERHAEQQAAYNDWRDGGGQEGRPLVWYTFHDAGAQAV